MTRLGRFLCFFLLVFPGSEIVAQSTTTVARATSSFLPYQSDSLRSSGRRSLSLIPSQLWSRSGAMEDTVLLQPGRMFATEGLLWVVDYSPPRVVQLDAATGRTLFSLGKAGRGPGEWIGPLSFVGTQGTNVAVFDVASRRLALITPARTVQNEPLPTLSLAQLACSSGNSGLVAASVGRNGSNVVTRVIRTTGAANSIVSNSDLPWPALRNLTPAASQVTLNATQNGCIMGPLYGSSVARFDRDGAFVDTIGLIERIPLPTVQTERRGRGVAVSVGPQSVRGVISLTRFGQYLVVAFGGRSAHRDRLLDFYEWQSGRYVGTLLSREELRDVRGTESTLYVQSVDDVGLYRIQALRLRAASGSPRVGSLALSARK